MSAECSNYSEMQICPQLRFTQNKQTWNIHNSENLPRVKKLLIVQIFNSRETLDVNTRCSPTTRFYFQPRKPKHTSPHQTTQQQWLHGYSGAPPSQRTFGKISAKTRVTRQATRIFFACCSSYHMGLEDHNGLSILAFLPFFFVFSSWFLSKQSRLCIAMMSW